MKPRILIALTGYLVSTGVFAACASYYCDDVYIDMIYTNANGRIYIDTSGDETLVTNCTLKSGLWFTLDPVDQNFDELYAFLLSAHMADKRVMVRTVDSSNPCKLSYARIFRQ